ncbi:MAG: hypothetical protein QOC83_7132 [Pseudonocardiales bacterium]|nr:hypothetical protein [Pseudonocardiales bacterium]
MHEQRHVPWKHEVGLVSSAGCRTGVGLEGRVLIHWVDRVATEGLSYGQTALEVGAQHLPMLADVEQLRIRAAQLIRSGQARIPSSRYLDRGWAERISVSRDLDGGRLGPGAVPRAPCDRSESPAGPLLVSADGVGMEVIQGVSRFLADAVPALEDGFVLGSELQRLDRSKVPDLTERERSPEPCFDVTVAERFEESRCGAPANVNDLGKGIRCKPALFWRSIGVGDDSAKDGSDPAHRPELKAENVDRLPTD